jgi:site-specific DNA recombinase
MKAAIYCRVSTEDQEREGTSLQTQLEACLRYCQNKGYNVAYRFSEAHSGLTLERPKLNELRELVRAGDIDVIVVYCLDRLSRDPTHGVILSQELEKHNVILEAVTETVDSSELGKLISYIRGFASKLEAEKIRERTMRAKRARALSGKLPGNSHARLYGYHYIKGKGDGQGIRIINDEEARWVREIFRWLVEEGLSVTAITMRLRGLGIANPSGTTFWSRSTVYGILTNLAYTGKTYAFTKTLAEPQKPRKQSRKHTKTRSIWKPREDWLEIPNATPPIISEEVFETAQARFTRNKELSHRHTKWEYLLSGYIHCRQCGKSYWGMVSGSRRGGVRRRYACAGKSKVVAPVPCRNRSFRAEDLDRLVWEQVEKVLIQPEMVIAELQRRRQVAEGDKGDGGLPERLKSLDNRIQSLQNREVRLVRFYNFGEFDEDTLRKEKQAIDTQRRRLEDEKLQLERRIEVQGQCTASIEGVQKFCDLVRTNIKQFSFQDKRLALEALQIRVWIDGDKVTIEGAVPVDEQHNEQRIVSNASQHAAAPRSATQPAL